MGPERADVDRPGTRARRTEPGVLRCYSYAGQGWEDPAFLSSGPLPESSHACEPRSRGVRKAVPSHVTSPHVLCVCARACVRTCVCVGTVRGTESHTPAAAAFRVQNCAFTTDTTRRTT